MKGGASSSQALDIHIVPWAVAPTSNIPMFPSGNMSHRHPHDPCCCVARDSDMALRGSGWDFNMAPGGRWMATHNTPPLGSLVPSLFIIIKPLHFSFFSIYPAYTHTLWRLPLQAGHATGRPLDDTLHLASWRGGEQLSMHLFCVPEGKSVGGIA